MLKALTFFSFPSFLNFKKQNKVVAKQVKIENRKLSMLTILILAINVYLLFSFVIGSNSYAFKGYELKQLQNEILLLQTQNKKMVLKVAEISSAGAIQENLENFNFVSAGNPKFLELKQFSLK